MPTQLRGSEAPSPDARKDTMAQQKARPYDMSLSSEVNMTNCSKHRERFFEKYPSIDCNVLIAYWMMAGYLGPIDSVQKAFQKGHSILMELTHKEGILKSLASGEDEDMNKIARSTESDLSRCRHQGFCDMENVALFDLLELDKLEKVTPTNGMLKDKKGSVLLLDGNHLSRQVFSSCKRLKYVAYFNPMPNSVKPLLENVKNPSVVLLRGCEFLSKLDIDLPFEKLKTLSVLEISGSSHLTTIPPEIFSKLTHLQCLNFSGLPIEQLPDKCLYDLKGLRWLILRGCSKLVKLPLIRDLSNLEVLDLSHCASLSKSLSQQIYSGQLKLVDLSDTSLTSIPVPKSTTLTHLFLRNSKLSVLSSLKSTSLQVLDLCGANNVKEVKELSQYKDLVVLDLSRTKITSLDSVSDKIHLRKLILHGCENLEKPPAMEKLESLEVLDLSGTKVKHLPSFGNPTSLRKLLLRDLELDSLETLASLSDLVEVDLQGVKISSPGEFKVDFLQSLENLKILDLSKTSVKKLPAMSNLTSLKELILSDCQHLNVVPDLETLTNLEKLDLSIPDDSTMKNGQAEIESEVQRGLLSLRVPSSLRKLVLTNRSGVQNLFSLATLSKLECLDLRGTDLTKIPYGKLDRLKCIRLPANIDLSGVHLGRMGNLQKELVWDSNISKPVEINILSSVGSKYSLTAGANRFFHLQRNQGSWEAFVYQFSVSQLPKGGKNEVIYLEDNEFIFRQNHSWARILLNLELEGRSIEIHGFPEYPKGIHQDILKGIQNSLQEALNVALVGNNFSCSISELCSEAIKVCCIRRCPEMKSVLGRRGENDGVVRCPESIVLSHLVGLESICDETLTTESIKALKHIYIDCCPLLNKVIAPQVPENLETLHIKFCKLKTLFEENVCLSKLQKLSLFDLPELEGITAELPSLETLSINQCRKLKNLDRVIKSARRSLEQVCLDSCLMLEHILPSSDVPENLKVLKISSCHGLLTLFESTGSSSSSTCKLHGLQTLRLWNLPKLKNIGGELSLVPPTLQLDPSLPQNITHQLSSAGN